MQATYTKFNKQVDDDKLREMRQIYRQASDQYLIPPQHTFVDKEVFMHELRRESLIIDGMPPEEVDKLGDLSKKTAQEIQQFSNRTPQRNPQPLKSTPANSGKNLRLILKGRLVNGEITLAEYRQMKAELVK
jgi:hypothetical protein